MPEDAKAMIQAAVERFGRIDVLVANTSVIPLSTIVDATPEDWDHVMSVDGRGMFLTCKYAIEAMLKTGCGSIVCLSSPATTLFIRTVTAKGNGDGEEMTSGGTSSRL